MWGDMICSLWWKKKKKTHSIRCIFIYRKRAACPSCSGQIAENHIKIKNKLLLCHYLRLRWGLGGFICVRCVYSRQHRGPGARHFLERALIRVSLSEGCVYKCQCAEGSVAVLNLQGPASSLSYRWVRVSGPMLIFKNSNTGKEWSNSVKNTQRHSDKEN